MHTALDIRMPGDPVIGFSAALPQNRIGVEERCRFNINDELFVIINMGKITGKKDANLVGKNFFAGIGFPRPRPRLRCLALQPDISVTLRMHSARPLEPIFSQLAVSDSAFVRFLNLNSAGSMPRR